MTSENNSSVHTGPLPIILDDEPFHLSYMIYDESRYPEFYRLKAEAFLQKLMNYGARIQHEFNLNESTILLDHSLSNFGLPTNMSAICSPPKHCRERVRFPIFPRVAFTEVESMFPQKVERFWYNKSICDDKEEELVYTMWEGGGGSALVHVSTFVHFHTFLGKKLFYILFYRLFQ